MLLQVFILKSHSNYIKYFWNAVSELKKKKKLCLYRIKVHTKQFHGFHHTCVIKYILFRVGGFLFWGDFLVFFLFNERALISHHQYTSTLFQLGINPVNTLCWLKLN